MVPLPLPDALLTIQLAQITPYLIFDISTFILFC